MSGTAAGPALRRVVPAGRDPRAVLRELGILLRFRLSAGGRDPRRSVAVIVGLVVGLGVVAPVSVALWAPRDYAQEALVVSPAVWFFFLLSAVVASFASAGGRELIPRREALAFPVSSTADQIGALLLTPLNSAWTLQAALVLSVAAYGVGSGPTLVTTLVAGTLWIVAATAVAQLLGWLAELIRTYRPGAVALRVVVLALAGAGITLISLGDVGRAIDRLPTVVVFIGGATADPLRYVTTQALVVSVAVAAVVLAVPLAERLARRPTPQESRSETVNRSRRPGTRAELSDVVWTDIRSILRSPPLSRGLVLLLVTPLLVAGLLPLPWVGIIVLPALICSSLALLHGVNIFSLDGRGALWRESLPQRPHVALAGRLLALTMLCTGSSVLVVALASVRAETPTAAEVTAVVVATGVATLQVVSRCALWSVTRPHQADLRRGRDTPAPPGAMAGYSVRLSAATTGAAVAFGVSVALGSQLLTILIGVILSLASLERLGRAFRTNDRSLVRSLVVHTIAGS